MNNVTTLAEAGKYLVAHDVVDFETMQVEGKQLLEVCGFSLTNVGARIMEQITKHNFVENTDYEITSVRNSITNRNSKGYHFTFKSSQHVLLAAMTAEGKQARQEAINLKEAVDAPAQGLVSLEGVGGMLQVLNGLYQTQVEQQAINTQVTTRLAEIEEKTIILPNKPQNAESISTIRTRINKKYGLPSWVVNEVVNTFAYAPRPAGQVKNSHEESGNKTYTVWNIAEINRLFERFVRECEDYSKTKSVHNLIEKPFKLL